MKGIKCCGECAYYSMKKHKCMGGAKDAGNETDSFYADCPHDEAEPVRHGRWIVHTTWQGMFGLIHSECSECKFDRNGDLSSWKFCPNCGAKMDGGADNATS